jgi:hypothetical protein
MKPEAVGFCSCDSPYILKDGDRGEYVCDTCGDLGLDPRTGAILRYVLRRLDEQAVMTSKLLRLSAEVARKLPSRPPPPPLTVAQTSKRLGRSPDWVRENAAKIGGYKSSLQRKKAEWRFPVAKVEGFEKRGDAA